MDKFTPQIAYRLEVPRNDASQTEIKFTAQSNFIAGLRIGEPYMSHTPPPKKNGFVFQQNLPRYITLQFIKNVYHNISIETILILHYIFILQNFHNFVAFIINAWRSC